MFSENISMRSGSETLWTSQTRFSRPFEYSIRFNKWVSVMHDNNCDGFGVVDVPVPGFHVPWWADLAVKIFQKT